MVFCHMGLSVQIKTKWPKGFSNNKFLLISQLCILHPVIVAASKRLTWYSQSFPCILTTPRILVSSPKWIVVDNMTLGWEDTHVSIDCWAWFSKEVKTLSWVNEAKVFLLNLQLYEFEQTPFQFSIGLSITLLKSQCLLQESENSHLYPLHFFFLRLFPSTYLHAVSFLLL